MSVYLKPAGGSLRQEEVHLYGSNRLGIATRHLAADTSINLAAGFGTIKGVKFTRGEKLFELSNHLGNVLVTISDRMIQQKLTGDTVRYYQADVVSANDYYPFGMQMPGRKFSAGVYRYGFNGKENDNEVKGTGNQQDYGMRIYDPRIGKFLSVDPLTKSYPWYTPYQFAGNTPIQAIDRDGSEPEYVFAHSRIQERKRNMTPEQAREYEQNGNKVGMAYMYGTFLLPLDAMTGFNGHRIAGTALTIFSVHNIFEYTNRNNHQNNPNIIKENNARAKEALGDIIIGEGISKVFGGLGRMVKGLASELDARFSGFNTRGLSVWEGDDAVRYLEGKAKAAYMPGADGQGTIILGKNATRQEIVEELIHHQQNLKYGDSYMVTNRNAIEIEAQDELLKIGKKEGWSKEAMQEIESAKKTWMDAYKKEKSN